MDNNEYGSKKNTKRILVTSFLILLLVVSVTGATYAYFAISATNDNTISGTAADPKLELTVEKIAPAASVATMMVPQYSAYNNKNTLKTAIDASCVDGNGNVVCQIYRIVIKNSSTNSAALRLRETLSLTAASGSTYNNLKWYTIAKGNNVNQATATGAQTYTYPGSFSAAYGNASTVNTLGQYTGATTLSQNNYRYYYVVVWIEEIGQDQGSGAAATRKDQGTFTGTVTVNAIDASGNTITGLTSTFTT